MRIASFIVDPLLSSLLRPTKRLFSTLQFTIGLCHHRCRLLPFPDVSIAVLVGCILCWSCAAAVWYVLADFDSAQFGPI